MSKTKIAVVASAAALVVSAVSVISFLGSEGALVERFAHLDPELVAKAHRRMFLAALKGDDSVANATSVEELDALFLARFYNQ